MQCVLGIRYVLLTAYLLLAFRIREHYPGQGGLEAIGGSDIDSAVVAVFVSLIWHTQSLREEIDRYGILMCCRLCIIIVQCNLLFVQLHYISYSYVPFE
jgi:ABC-type amino acid transport system permease subunit